MGGSDRRVYLEQKDAKELPFIFDYDRVGGRKNMKFKISKMIADAFGAVREPTVVMGTTLLVDAAIGTFATGFYAAQNSYKFKRLKENTTIAIEELFERLENVELLLSSENRDIFENKLFPTFWDFVIDEPESEKIQLFVNGLEVALNQKEIDMEMIYIYFDILSQLRVKEIMLFQDVYIQKNYKIIEGTSSNIAVNGKIDVTHHIYARNKLEKVGLITLHVISGNGTIDEHYQITDLGKRLFDYFSKLNVSIP